MQDSKFKYFYNTSNDIHLIVKNAYQFAILQYLIQLQNGYSNAHASKKTLSLGLMSVRKAIDTLTELEQLGYIESKKYDSYASHNSNDYFVKYDNINIAIMKALSAKELGKKSRKEMSEQQKYAITLKHLSQHPEIVHKVEAGLGNTVKDNNGNTIVKPSPMQFEQELEALKDRAINRKQAIPETGDTGDKQAHTPE